MEYVTEFFSNKILISGIIGWATAQVLKTIIFLVINKKFQLERLFGDGGMPSGHSATVTAVAVSTGIECGLSSPLFAIATIIAIVVMHDAMGVRLETGKQAKVINEMMGFMEKLGGTELSYEEKLKEFVGHTPAQVGAGLVLGIVVAILVHL
ncbi:MAG: divergent PAP2 family protein [Eubacterium sp.]|nr:divergent PAP2 family protein [Eubacterium sp.]